MGFWPEKTAGEKARPSPAPSSTCAKHHHTPSPKDDSVSPTTWTHAASEALPPVHNPDGHSRGCSTLSHPTPKAVCPSTHLLSTQPGTDTHTEFCPCGTCRLSAYTLLTVTGTLSTQTAYGHITCTPLQQHDRHTQSFLESHRHDPCGTYHRQRSHNYKHTVTYVGTNTQLNA